MTIRGEGCVWMTGRGRGGAPLGDKRGEGGGGVCMTIRGGSAAVGGNAGEGDYLHLSPSPNGCDGRRIFFSPTFYDIL